MKKKSRNCWLSWFLFAWSAFKHLLTESFHSLTQRLYNSIKILSNCVQLQAVLINYVNFAISIATSLLQPLPCDINVFILLTTTTLTALSTKIFVMKWNLIKWKILCQQTISKYTCNVMLLPKAKQSSWRMQGYGVCCLNYTWIFFATPKGKKAFRS